MAKMNAATRAIAEALPKVTVQAVVTLTVTPQEGQSTEAAAAEMLELFTQYVTERESPFLTDYGATTKGLALCRSGESDQEPTWGGYEGPFVIESTVEAVDATNAPQ
jgi:hypothetical protein